MTNFSIIQKSQLEGAERIDAEYYQPEYLTIASLLKQQNTLLLHELISRPVVTGSTPTFRECKLDGTDIRFIKTDTVREGEINFDLADFLPISQNRKISELKEKDILVTIIGASYEIVGRVGLVYEDDPRANINQNIALIRPSKKINPYFLEIFLSSKFGRLQLWQQSRQTEQVNLNCREVELVKVPLLVDSFQKNIEKIVLTSRALKQESSKFYQQAEELLLKELGLNNFQPKEDLSFVVNLSEVKDADRIDADFFQPKYKELIDHFLNRSKPLLKSSKRVSNFQKIDSQKDYDYIEISDINTSSGDVISNRLKGKELPASAKIKIQGGELLISKVRPTRGAVAVVDEDMTKNYVVSNAFSVFKFEYPIREYMQVILKSIVGKLQMEKPTTGTSYPTITDLDVENLVIPILSQDKQQEIADLVRKSHEARKKSKELLEQAKREVEEMIEQSADTCH